MVLSGAWVWSLSCARASRENRLAAVKMEIKAIAGKWDRRGEIIYKSDQTRVESSRAGEEDRTFGVVAYRHTAISQIDPVEQQKRAIPR